MMTYCRNSEVIKQREAFDLVWHSANWCFTQNNSPTCYKQKVYFGTAQVLQEKNLFALGIILEEILKKVTLMHHSNIGIELDDILWSLSSWMTPGFYNIWKFKRKL